MSLNKELVERFQVTHKSKYNVAINYSIAEQNLKELAELVRICSNNEGVNHA
jgi:hypothetical protein